MAVSDQALAAIQNIVSHELSSSLFEALNNQIKTILPSIVRDLQANIQDDVPACDATSMKQGLPPPDLVNQTPALIGRNNSMHISGDNNTSIPNPSRSPNLMNQSTADKLSFRSVLVHTHEDKDAHTPLVTDSSNMIAQRKGEYLSLTVDESLVRTGITQLQHSLIGKLTLATGDSPYSLEELTTKLGHIWGVVGI